MDELTKKDLKEVFLESLEPFAKSVQKDFQRIDQRFDGIDKRFEQVDKRFDGIYKRFDHLEGRVTKIETTMVTKDYLDEKLADLRGDLVVLMRKEDKKLQVLVEILKERKIISEEDIKRILSLEPFPQLSK